MQIFNTSRHYCSGKCFWIDFTRNILFHHHHKLKSIPYTSEMSELMSLTVLKWLFTIETQQYVASKPSETQSQRPATGI